jgi:uncharacterized membrane protein YtjA (UPF0391 family)
MRGVQNPNPGPVVTVKTYAHSAALMRSTGMLKYAIIFALIALIAGALGFTGVAGASATIAKILFFVCMVIFLILLAIAVFVGKKLL